MDVLKSNSEVIVYLDIKSPYAFISVKPTLALERELGLSFDWRPYTLDIPSYLGSARKEKGKVVESRGRSPKIWNAVRYAYMDARRYAEKQGYVLKGTEKIWDSSLANMGILFTNLYFRDYIPAYLEAVYPPFWRRELDIEDINVVIQCWSLLVLIALSLSILPRAKANSCMTKFSKRASMQVCMAYLLTSLGKTSFSDASISHTLSLIHISEPTRPY